MQLFFLTTASLTQAITKIRKKRFFRVEFSTPFYDTKRIIHLSKFIFYVKFTIFKKKINKMYHSLLTTAILNGILLS